MIKIPFMILICCVTFCKSLLLCASCTILIYKADGTAEHTALRKDSVCSSRPDQKIFKTPSFVPSGFLQPLAPAPVGTCNLLAGDLTPSSLHTLPCLQGPTSKQVTKPGETKSLRSGVLPPHLAGGGDEGRDTPSWHCALRGGEGEVSPVS